MRWSAVIVSDGAAIGAEHLTLHAAAKRPAASPPTSAASNARQSSRSRANAVATKRVRPSGWLTRTQLYGRLRK
jgi:hypothetical protein